MSVRFVCSTAMHVCRCEHEPCHPTKPRWSRHRHHIAADQHPPPLELARRVPLQPFYLRRRSHDGCTAHDACEPPCAVLPACLGADAADAAAVRVMERDRPGSPAGSCLSLWQVVQWPCVRPFSLHKGQQGTVRSTLRSAATLRFARAPASRPCHAILRPVLAPMPLPGRGTAGQGRGGRVPDGSCALCSAGSFLQSRDHAMTALP